MEIYGVGGGLHYDNENKNYMERFEMHRCLGKIDSLGNYFKESREGNIFNFETKVWFFTIVMPSTKIANRE